MSTDLYVLTIQATICSLMEGRMSSLSCGSRDASHATSSASINLSSMSSKNSTDRKTLSTCDGRWSDF